MTARDSIYRRFLLFDTTTRLYKHERICIHACTRVPKIPWNMKPAATTAELLPLHFVKLQIPIPIFWSVVLSRCIIFTTNSCTSVLIPHLTKVIVWLSSSHWYSITWFPLTRYAIWVSTSLIKLKNNSNPPIDSISQLINRTAVKDCIAFLLPNWAPLT